MKFNIKSAAFLLLSIGTLTFSGCGDKKPKEETTTDSLTTDTVTTSNTTVTDKFLNELPQVSEIPAMLQLTGADFNPTLINPSNKVENYTTTSDKAALNLGVYGTDIGYLASYNKTQDILNQVKAAQKLAEKVGITKIFDASIQKRFEANLSKKDSLIGLVNESMVTADKYLKESDRSNTAALIAVGAVIEGLSISTGLIEKYPKNVSAEIRDGVLGELVLTIARQKKTLGDLISILKAAKQDDIVKEYTGHLKDLHKKFETLNIEEQLKNNKGDLKITPQILTDITPKVKEIRNKIVG